MSLVKLLFKTILRTVLMILIFYNCLFLFLKIGLYNWDIHIANYPRTSMDQTQKNLPVYLEKINKILDEYNLPKDNFRVVNDNFLGGDIVINNSEIDITISNNYDREELKASFRKIYKNVTQLVDLEPPSQDEYRVLCDIVESISGVSTVHYIKIAFALTIFDEKNLQKNQTSFQNGEYFQIEATDYLTDYGDLWIVLDYHCPRLKEFYDNPPFEENEVSLSMTYFMTLENSSN